MGIELEKLRLLIADDDVLAANSLKIIVEAGGQSEVVALAKDGAEAFAQYKHHKPDICLLDIQMGEHSGLEAAQQILDYDPEAKIIFLTTFKDEDYIRQALTFGVKGYLLKQDYNAIEAALQAVAEGQTVFGAEIVSKILAMLGKLSGSSAAGAESGQNTGSDTDALLNAKELECAALVAQGLSNKEIASSLYLSEGTVRNMISQILEKLALRDRTQLAIYYLRKNKQ